MCACVCVCLHVRVWDKGEGDEEEGKGGMKALVCVRRLARRRRKRVCAGGLLGLVSIIFYLAVCV